MPVHCALYVDDSEKRRLSCFKLQQPGDANDSDRIAVRFGAAAPQAMQRLVCTCAPVHDYTGRQVARVGLSLHAVDDRMFAHDQTAVAMDLARRISVRLGYLPAASVA
jgi:hypothetical protein